MDITIDIIRSFAGWDDLGPLDEAVEAAARGAIARAVESGETNLPEGTAAEMSIVLAGDAFVADLNGKFRGQNKPTNVLSFPAEPFHAGQAEGEPLPLGDIVIACETLLREAEAEGKAPLDHLRHLVVHGALHLLGFDHIDDADAERMEALERRILAGLGAADPYQDSSKQAGTTG